MITKILKFQFETKKDSRYRIEYFGEQYPQDTNDDLVEWVMKNREYIPSYSSPKGGKRGCLCIDEDKYDVKCCNGDLREQGIGPISKQ